MSKVQPTKVGADETVESPIKRKPGRPRIHKDHAAAQAAYKKRQKIKAARALRQASQLKVVPFRSLKEANALVTQLHRHHSAINSHKFSIGVKKNDRWVAAAICQRPCSRHNDNGLTIEVARLASDGTDNCCSLLYGACARVAKEMGYERIVTYILETEPGTSLKGAGWVLEATGCGGTPQGKRKNRPNNYVITPVTFMKKQRWGKML